MGKLKEKLLNNRSEDENPFELSAFEYVEYMSNYKESEEYIPTEEELEKLEQMVKDYYNSKEFREYVENYQPGESLEDLEDEFFGKWTSADIDAALAQHNAHEEGFDIDEINDNLKVKFTEDEVIEAVKAMKNEEWFIKGIKRELNKIWNKKNGFDF
jgi:hypothetical protein